MGEAGSVTSFEFVGVNLWFYSPSMLVGLRHSLARKSILGSGLKPFPSRVFPSGGIGIQMLEGRDICRAVGLPASTCLAVPPHRRDGIAWERGRPARILSLWPPLSFSAMPQSRCRRQLPCRRELQRPGRRRAMARPAQSVVASPSNSTNQGTEDKPLFTMHSATW